MKIRFKFLIFLGAFLGGAFLIISWKSYNIFAQKYVAVVQQKENESLEHMGFYLSQRLKAIESLFQIENPTPQHLSRFHIKLLAHVINDGGQWKAQWHEGQEGMRSMAQVLTKQVPFESLSVVRPTWHFVNYKDRGQGVAYIVPGRSQQKMEFYTVFFDFDFFKDVMGAGPSQDMFAIVSPVIGEVFSTGKNMNFSSDLEKNKQSMSRSQSGFFKMDAKHYASYVFNPDIQLYMVKVARSPMLGVPPSAQFVILGVLAAFLLCIALFAQDVLLRTLFARIDESVQNLKSVQVGERPETSAPTQFDELYELESTVHSALRVQPLSTTAPVSESIAKPSMTTNVPAVMGTHTEKTKAHLINSLGYLQKLKKESGPSSYLTLLETELRDLRRELDPVSMTFDPFKINTEQLSQSTENVVLKNNDIESFIKDFKNRSSVVPPTATPSTTVDVVSSSVVNDTLFEIRKPKREAHESKNV